MENHIALLFKSNTLTNFDKAKIFKKWLSDKLVYEVEDEEVALEALQVAEESISSII